MNEVLVSLWYIMGLWPLVYSMLLLPTGRRYLSVFYRFFQHVTTIYHSVFTMSLILWNKLIRLSIVFLNNHIYLILQFPSLLLPQPSNAAITSVCLLELISFFLVGHCEVLSVWCLIYRVCSSKSRIRVWPFLILSCFGGAYTLLPYFILWRPPPPLVQEAELRRWPLNFMESKVTAVVRYL